MKKMIVFGVMSWGICMAGQMPYKSTQEAKAANQSQSVAEREPAKEQKAETKPAAKIHGAARRITGEEKMPQETSHMTRKSAAKKVMEAELMAGES